MSGMSGCNAAVRTVASTPFDSLDRLTRAGRLGEGLAALVESEIHTDDGRLPRFQAIGIIGTL
jgi:hypothetical protein